MQRSIEWAGRASLGELLELVEQGLVHIDGEGRVWPVDGAVAGSGRAAPGEEGPEAVS